MTEFRECEACAAKAGSPNLCHSCIRNRAIIQTLEEAVKRLVKAEIILGWIEERLDKRDDSRK